MKAYLTFLAVCLKLHFRNRMALIYGFLFPLIFLIAFWVLYRHDRVPLIRHLGELLTVSILGGACFGLPTTLVSERERGVWRRYRLTPVSPAGLLVGTLVARYGLILLAGLLQLALAFSLGMPAPAHPLALWAAFTTAAFAFIGLGLVIAALADNVPAVQALGQCIFLPMLIIGGVAVPLTALPEWAQHVSAFFPGRYAVEALQASANGDGLGAEGFALLALVILGVAGVVAGTRLFRWDAQQSFRAIPGKGWLALVFAGWISVGLLAESRGRILPRVAADPEIVQQAPASPEPQQEPTAAAPTPEPAPAAPTPPPDATPTPPSSSATTAEQTPPPTEPAPDDATPRSWREITSSHLTAIRHFGVPPDHGVVAPYADPSEQLDDFVASEIDDIRALLPDWGPGRVTDPVQRVRNLLYVAAVPDAIQLPIERYIPPVVLETMEARVPRDDLIKILGWIVLHPMEGDLTALTRVNELGLEDAVQVDVVRERAYYYAIKYLNRLSER